jgi:AcrR family transcriptional regulator
MKEQTRSRPTPSSGQGAATRPYQMRERQRAVERTRDRILEAAFELFRGQPYDEVSLDAVASLAGVSRQTVHRQFGTKEDLIGAVIDWRKPQEDEADRQVEAGDIGGAVHQLVDRYETTGDAIVRFLALEGRIEPIDRLLAHGRRSHRGWIEHHFGAFLRDEGDREEAVLALYAATDVMVWKLLRRDVGRSRRQTEASMRRLVEGVLDTLGATDREGRR